MAIRAIFDVRLDAHAKKFIFLIQLRRKPLSTIDSMNN